MSEYLKNLVTHIRPELLVKWFAVGGPAFLGAVTYDYATKESDKDATDEEIKYDENGERIIDRDDEIYVDQSGEIYLTLKMEE